MICRNHGIMNDDGTCPYCRIAELEQALREIGNRAAEQRLRWFEVVEIVNKALEEDK